MGIENELVTIKRDDLNFMKEGFKFLMDENAKLKAQLEPEEIDFTDLDLSGIHAILTATKTAIIEDEDEEDSEPSDFN